MIAAFDAYAKYTRDEQKDDEFYQKVDEKTVPGTVSWQKDFATDAQVDERKLISLNWDEILRPGKTGAVFLTAESFFSHNLLEDKSLLLMMSITAGRAVLNSPQPDRTAMFTRSHATWSIPQNSRFAKACDATIVLRQMRRAAPPTQNRHIKDVRN